MIRKRCDRTRRDSVVLTLRGVVDGRIIKLCLISWKEMNFATITRVRVVPKWCLAFRNYV